MNPSNTFLWTQVWNTLLVFLGRPGVQWQLLAGGLALVVAVVPGRWLQRRWQRIGKRSLDTAPFTRRVAYSLVRHLLPGGLMLLALQVLRAVLAWQGARTGLLEAFDSIVWVYLGLSAMLALVCAVGGEDSIRHYRKTLILPLFVVVLGAQVLQLFLHDTPLSTVPAVTLFGQPLTLSALFLVTVGFYLWIVGIHAAGQGIHYLATRYGSVDEGSSQATLTLLRYLLIIIGIGYVLYRLNFDPTTIAAISGGLSVGVGFALSTILSNFVSGILLLFERTLRPGDVIEFNGEISIVDQITIRFIRVHTPDNVEKIIPNSEFVTSPFTTYTGQTPRVRLRVPIGVSYHDPPRKVIRTLLEVAARSPHVLKQPAPDVRIEELGDFSITYTLYVWVANPRLGAVTRHNLHQAVLDAFEAQGITIPFPTVTLNQETDG